MSFELNLNRETVAQITASDPLCLEVGTSVRTALHEMRERRRGAVLICREGKLVGIFTERDALKLMLPGVDLDIPVEQVMTANPKVIAEHETVGKAIATMSRGGYRRLPIVDAEGRPKGFVKASAILHYLVGHFPAIVYNLPPDPHHTTQTREGA